MNENAFSLAWMAWTQPVAIFFVSIVVMLVFFGVLQVIYPTHERRGFLPVPTTRGDRLFMSLLGAAFIHLIWLAFSDANLLIASGISVAYAAVMMRWG